MIFRWFNHRRRAGRVRTGNAATRTGCLGGLPATRPTCLSRQHTMKKQRSLTIREMADAYLLRQGRATSSPAIRLQGKWLAQAGFEAGQKVTVHVEDGRIVITPQDVWSCQAE